MGSDDMIHHLHNMVWKTNNPKPGQKRQIYQVCEGPAADAEDPWRNGCGLDTRIKAETPVRVVNWAGPCITDTVVSVGRSRYKLMWHGTAKHFIEVHYDPCTRCTDHPETVYPNGYTN